MPKPMPGRPVRGSETGRPIMAILDLLGRRWTLRIGWELRDGPLAFRELQRRCGMPSPNILTTRLRESAEVKLVEKCPDGLYRLTRRGQSLLELLNPLDEWAKGWSHELARQARPKKSR